MADGVDSHVFVLWLSDISAAVEPGAGRGLKVPILVPLFALGIRQNT